MAQILHKLQNLSKVRPYQEGGLLFFPTVSGI
ncbi:hypothetical protein CFREI_11955 [Corynebacterium freiburgense]|nr:hypothetical protein CFREI_11955 [Corynebacterium freiburgense]